MVIIQIAGGVGNQLQQYALYQKFLSIGVDARLDISWFDGLSHNTTTKRELEFGFFTDLNYKCCTLKEKEKLIGKAGFSGKIRRNILPGTIRLFTESEIYHPEIFTFTDMYLTGYFACEKYYADILPKLRKQIRFKPSPKQENQKTALEMTKHNSVAIHIRRGDYLNPENQALFGNICTEEYYESAIDYISQRVDAPHFYLFSDDSEYIMSKYKGDNYTHINWNKREDSIYDMYLMSCCKNIICANSTFSFWGARLNGNEGKIMVRPARHKNTQPIDKPTLLPLWQGWTLIDNDTVLT